MCLHLFDPQSPRPHTGLHGHVFASPPFAFAQILYGRRSQIVLAASHSLVTCTHAQRGQLYAGVRLCIVCSHHAVLDAFRHASKAVASPEWMGVTGSVSYGNTICFLNEHWTHIKTTLVVSLPSVVKCCAKALPKRTLLTSMFCLSPG